MPSLSASPPPRCSLNVLPLDSRRSPRWFLHIIICLWSWTGRLQHVRLVTAWFQGWLFWKADGFGWSRSKFFWLMMISVTLQAQLWSNFFPTLVTYETKTGNTLKKSKYTCQIVMKGSKNAKNMSFLLLNIWIIKEPICNKENQLLNSHNKALHSCFA